MRYEPKHTPETLAISAKAELNNRTGRETDIYPGNDQLYRDSSSSRIEGVCW
jgi:hypothetical protein